MRHMFTTPEAVITLKTDSKLNTTHSGNSLPLKVSLYQLSSTQLVDAKMQNQTTMAINNNLQKTFTLYPRQVEKITWKLQKNTTVIAVVSKFHRLNEANWRVFIPVDPKQGKNVINIKFVANQVYVRKL